MALLWEQRNQPNFKTFTMGIKYGFENITEVYKNVFKNLNR